MRVILSVFLVGLSFNISAVEYSGQKGKEVFNQLNSSLNLGCYEKNCDFRLTYLTCSSIQMLNKFKCTAQRTLDDGIELKSITNQPASSLFNQLSKLNDSVECQNVFGVTTCSVSEVTCAKSTKLFIEKFNCDLE